MEVMDRANARWGRDAIYLAACGIKQDWTMEQAARSPQHATCRADLPEAKAAEATAR